MDLFSESYYNSDTKLSNSLNKSNYKPTTVSYYTLNPKSHKNGIS